jgi:ZIP family zinc transporter
MSFLQTTALGAIAGATIFLGLPVGRARHLDARWRVALSMLSAGILVFILVDVSSEGMGIVENHLDALKNHHGSLSSVVGVFALLAGGFIVGVGGIASFQRRFMGRRPAPPLPPLAGGQSVAVLSGAEMAALGRDESASERRALRTGMTIASAIGMHNMAEGLAIGVAAQAGQVSLATVLIIGFALHNATEGFGIVGPLGGVRPSWRWLGMAGVIGGAPTFLGSMIGYQISSDALELAFYALAGGAILYVIGEIWAGVRRHGHTELGLYMLGVGFALGVATDLIVAYGGA